MGTRRSAPARPAVRRCRSATCSAGAGAGAGGWEAGGAGVQDETGRKRIKRDKTKTLVQTKGFVCVPESFPLGGGEGRCARGRGRRGRSGGARRFLRGSRRRLLIET